jgi:hypothetical protein
MKKKLLSFFSVALGCALAFTSLQSSSGGQLGGGSAGCSCHGPSNAGLGINIVGLPATFTAGATYTLAVTVSSSTAIEAGFDLIASAGDFNGTSATTYNMNGAKTDVTHKSPLPMTAGVATFGTIIYRAPSTPGNVTFNLAGNATNNNGGTGGDVWNTFTASVPVEFAASIADNQSVSVECVPSLVQSATTVKATNITRVQVLNMNGQVVMSKQVNSSNEYSLDCSNLTSGNYIIKGSTSKGNFTSKITKQ